METNRTDEARTSAAKVQSRSMGSRASRQSWRAIVALLLALALVATACGSDGDDTSTTAAATTDPAPTEAPVDDAPADDEPADTMEDDEPADGEMMEATGEPIKVMVAGTIQSPVFSVPSTTVGAQVAIDQINASGGIDGRPIEMIVCNDEFDPNKAAACIQSAGAEGAVGLVGGLTVFEPLLYPLLEAEGLPWVTPAPSAMLDSPWIFPISDGVSNFAGIGAIAVVNGCENPAIVISANGSQANSDNIRAGIESSGGTVSADLQGAGPDFAPLVESALAAGADCFASGLSPAELPGLLAANAGRLTVTTVDGPLPNELLASLDGAADGMHVVSGFLRPASGDERVLALQELSEVVAPGVGMEQFWFNGYVGMNLIAEALKGVDDPSPETLLAGLKNISGYDTGVGPIVDFTTPNSVASLASVYNPNVYTWNIVDGAYQLASDEVLNVQPAVELLGQG